MDLRKILLIFFLPLFFDVISSGCCDCDDPMTLVYSHCTLSLSNLDNTLNQPNFTNADTIAKEAYGIRLHVRRNENLCLMKPRRAGFLKSAYAISCDCGPSVQYLPVDSITHLQIFTVFDFDVDREAGSDVTDYFAVFRENSFVPPLNQFQSLGYTLDDELLEYLELDVLLMSIPAVAGPQQFNIRLHLSDGRIFQQTTEQVFLK